MELVLTPLSRALGARLDCDALASPTPELFAALRRAWLDHLVLVVHGRRLDPGQLASFGRGFGTLKGASLMASHGDGDGDRAGAGSLELVHTVSNVVRDGRPIGILGAGAVPWHSDMAGFAEPPSASMLHALEVPERGGETYFNNTYLAHDTLPPKLKQRLRGYTIHHRVRAGSAGAGDGAHHPLVCTHPETGHDALCLGARPNTSIDQLTRHESDRLLGYLWSHATLPDFGMRHRWKPGDLLVWDNRCTLHCREPFDPMERRILLRVQVEGGVAPALVEGSAARGPHPRGAAVYSRA